jgi:hypothetical protein
MGGAWKALIVAVLVTASMLAVFYAWRKITVPAGIVVIIVGTGTLLINLLVSNRSLSLLDVMTSRNAWSGPAPVAVLPFFACVATVWAGRRARSAGQTLGQWCPDSDWRVRLPELPGAT